MSITEPLEPTTFPYLTTENLTFPLADMLFEEIKILSDVSFVAPYKFIGSDALSVDAITFVTLFSIEALTTFPAPPMFVLIHSCGLYSAILTCFNAAA